MRALVFPGQGVQKKGMGRDLFDAFPELVAQADTILGYSIKSLCLDDPQQRLNRTRYTQPAIYVVNALHYFQLRERNQARADYVAGFSLGEYNALLAAGAFDFATGLRLVQRRAELMDEAGGGAMAAVVGLDEAALLAALAPHRALRITVANYNAPRQFVLSGAKADMERLKPLLERAPGVELYVALQTSGAFHSPYMEEAARRFGAALSGTAFGELALPVIANVTARPYGADRLQALMTEQIAQPVRWSDSIRYLLEQGVTEFTELGGGTVLSAMIGKIREDAASRPAPLLAQILRRCAATANRAIQIFHGDDGVSSVTGNELAARVQILGSALQRRAAAQDRVVLAFAQHADFTAALLACWHANVIAVPAPISDAAQFPQKRTAIEAIARSSGARFILSHGALAQAMDGAAAPAALPVLDMDALLREDGSPAAVRSPAPGELALLLYTSGSTAQPKGVMLGHDAIHHTAMSQQWALSERSRVVSWLPQFHAFGISFGTLAPLAHGALSVTFPPDHFVAAPERWLALIDQYQATHTGAPNFAFDYCCSAIDAAAVASLSLASLQALPCGGDLIRKDAYERFVQRFAPLGLRDGVLAPNYGLSEAGPITVKRLGQPPVFMALDEDALLRKQVRPAPSEAGAKQVASCGEIDALTRIVIVDGDTGLPCAPDQVGEVWLKTPCQAQGYWEDPEQTRQAFDGTLSSTGERGFLRTGDLGFVAGGQLYIVGREKDVIIVNGKNYHPADIEATIKGEVAACQLACAAFAHEAGAAQQVVVVQEVAHGLAQAALQDIAARIVRAVSHAHQLAVHEVLLVAPGAVPVTGSRKIRRAVCRQHYLDQALAVLARHGGQPTDAAPGAIADLMAAFRRQVLEPELGARAASLGDDQQLSLLGLDSIRYIRIARKVETVFGVAFKAGHLYAHDSCRALAHYLHAQLAAAAAHAGRRRWRAYADPDVLALLRACAQRQARIERTLELIKENI